MPSKIKPKKVLPKSKKSKAKKPWLKTESASARTNRIIKAVNECDGTCLRCHEPLDHHDSAHKLLCKKCFGIKEEKLKESTQYDALVAAVDSAPHQLVAQASADEFLDLIAEVYNGGFQQYCEHGHFEKYRKAINALTGLRSAQAAELKKLLYDPALVEAMRSYNTVCNRHRDEHHDCEAASEELGAAADAAENFIYNANKMDPIFTEITAKLK